MQRDAALGQDERLLVAMLHQCHVRLVMHDAREHIVGRYRHREAFTLPQPRDGFVCSARLREQYRGQRMNERQVTPVADSMKSRGRLRQVLTNDARVANLLVAKGELIVSKTDRARVMRALGMLQRSCMERDRTRLFTARERDATVQSPQVGKPGVGDLFFERVRRTAKDG